MKLFFLITIVIFSISCKPKKPLSTVNKPEIVDINCPNNGTCTFEILKNKVLNIKEDEFGNLYPDITDGNALVLKFQFLRDSIPNTEDSEYREVLLMQLDSNQSDIELEGSDLQNVKLLFGRLCFCRGQTGYYKIDKGRLSVVKSDSNKYTLNLDFKCDAVPQILQNLNQSFEY